MYMDEGELEFDEDEMAALEGQRLVAELFPDSGYDCTDAFHSLPQVPVGSGVQEARPSAKRNRRH